MEKTINEYYIAIQYIIFNLNKNFINLNKNLINLNTVLLYHYSMR